MNPCYVDRESRIYGKISSGIHGNSAASERFWTLEERIKKDRKNPGLIVEMSRRRLLSNLANLAAYGVIHKSDLEEFSDKMKKDIEEIMDYNGIDYK